MKRFKLGLTVLVVLSGIIGLAWIWRVNDRDLAAVGKPADHLLNSQSYTFGSADWVSRNEIGCYVSSFDKNGVATSSIAYRLNVDTGEKTLVEAVNTYLQSQSAKGINYEVKARSSPDGRWFYIPFDGRTQIKGDTRSGVIISWDGKTHRYISERVGAGVWSQDSKSIVAVFDDPDSLDNGTSLIQTYVDQDKPPRTYHFPGNRMPDGEIDYYLVQAMDADRVGVRDWDYRAPVSNYLEISLSSPTEPPRTLLLIPPAKSTHSTAKFSPNRDWVAWELYCEPKSNANNWLSRLFARLGQARPKAHVEYWVAKPDGSHPQLIAHTRAIPAHFIWEAFSWSPDGKRLLIGYEYGLWALPVPDS